MRIALTHAHGDHIGSLDALAKTLPDIEISISDRDARLLAKNTTTDPGEPPEAKMRGSYPGAKTRPTRMLTAGDRVGSLEVVASPGHTPGHIAFLDTRDRTLIAGDAYSTIGGVATTAKVNPLFPLPVMATWHKPTALESARALRALDPVPPRGRPRPHRRRPRRRDGQGDRPRPEDTTSAATRASEVGSSAGIAPTASATSSASSGSASRSKRAIAFGDGEEGLGVDAHAAVRGADLDELVGRGVEARAPLDDAVAARVHGDVADVVRERAGHGGPELAHSTCRAGS